MMDRFREGMNGPLAWAFFLVIIVSFVFTGVSNFFVGGDRDAVVEVNGQKITRIELDQALRNEQNRMGENYARLVNTPEAEKRFREGVLDQLVSREVLRQAIGDLDLRMGTDAVREEVQKFPAFQRDGKFHADTAERLIIQAGLTLEGFRKQIEQDMTANQLLRAVGESAFVLPGETTRVAQLDGENRSGRFARVPLAKFTPTSNPEEEEITAYYTANEKEFAVPEKVSLQYLELNDEALSADVKFTDEDLKAYYDSHQNEFGAPEKRRVAHILLTIEGKDEAKVKAEADALFARVSGGEDFAALAKQMSEDPVSKEKGGELDALEKGVMPAEFDTAAFALTTDKPLSAVVKTEFGFHLIKLLALEPATVQPLEQVRDTVTEAVKKEKAAALFAEKEQLLNEKGFESSDSLEDAAKASGLAIKETAEFARNAPVDIAREAAVLEAAFSDDVLKDNRNSAMLSIGERRSVMVRIKSHQPASVKPLDDVRAVIVQTLNTQKGKAAAEAWGKDALARLRKGEDIAALLTEKEVSWEGFDAMTRQGPTPDFDIKQALFKVPQAPEGKASQSGVLLDRGDYLLAEVSKVTRPEAATLDAARVQQISEQLKRLAGESDYAALIETLKKRATLKQRVVSGDTPAE